MPHLARIVLVALVIAAACTSSRPPVAATPDKHVRFALLEDYDKGESLEQIARDFELFKELGVSTWRGSFGWDDYEPSRGAYDFGWLHRFADLAASRGITLRPYIGYTPAWASAGGSDKDVWNDPPRALEDWERFVRTLATEMRVHRNIVSYEIYNEENVKQWWDGSPDLYREVLRRGAAAVKAGNPEAQVLLGGMVYPDLEWLETVCGDRRTGLQIDIIPFHAYPETWTPPGVTVENYLGDKFASAFIDPADAVCGRKALWINETGFATTPGRSETDQARWWVRAVATFVAAPRIEHIGIYEIKDLAQGRAVIGDAPNYHLGITRENREKKIAFGTLTRLVSMLDGAGIAVSTSRMTVTASPADVTVYRHLFTRTDERQLLFLWTRNGQALVSMQLPATNAQVIEYALDGSPARQRSIADGRLQDVALQAGEVRFFEILPK